MSTKSLGKVTITPKGAWNSSYTYKRLDVVTNAGASFIALTDVPANTATSNGSYWMKLAAKGESVASVAAEKTDTTGAVDTYTITFTYTDESTDTITLTVTNGSVTSVAGKTGAVTLGAGDVGYDGTASYTSATVGGEVNALKSAFDSTIDIISFDLLQDVTPTEQTILNYSAGTTQASTGFFTYEKIDVSGLIGARLHTYSSYVATLGNAYYSRYSFYNADNEFISGYNPNESNDIGTLIPTTAKYVSICFSYNNGRVQDGKPTVWASVFSGNPNGKKIENGVNYNKNADIFMPYKGHRKGVISIVIDGEYSNNAQIVGIAEKSGFRMGIAAPWVSGFDVNGIDLYRSWQKNGHEILVHGYYNIGTGSTLTDEEIAQSIKDAYTTSIANGFDMHGYVAYQGNSKPSSREVIKKYFDYAFSMGNHAGSYSAPGNEPCVFIDKTEPYMLYRYSLELSTLQQMKDAVDRCISTGSYLCFYGHTDNIGGNFTADNFNALCTYIANKTNNYEVEVLTPYKAFQKYYTLRSTDLFGTWEDISNSVTPNESTTVISNFIRRNKNLRLVSICTRLRTTEALSGSSIVLLSGIPTTDAAYYLNSSVPSILPFIYEGNIRHNGNFSIASGADIIISGIYHTKD